MTTEAFRSGSSFPFTRTISMATQPLVSGTVAHRRRFRWRGTVAALLLVPSGVVTILSTPLVAESSWLDLGIDALAWASFVAGAAFRFWATLYIGGRKEAFLVTDGPYSVCRNPLYVGSLLLAVATGLFLKSLLFAVALTLVAVLYMLTTVPVEEEFLRARYRTDYDSYVRRVPRYWAAFRGFHSRSQLTVDLHALRLECARASRWVWLPLLGESQAHLRGHPWWPQMFRWL